MTNLNLPFLQAQIYTINLSSSSRLLENNLENKFVAKIGFVCYGLLSAASYYFSGLPAIVLVACISLGGFIACGKYIYYKVDTAIAEQIIKLKAYLQDLETTSLDQSLISGHHSQIDIHHNNPILNLHTTIISEQQRHPYLSPYSWWIFFNTSKMQEIQKDINQCQQQLGKATNLSLVIDHISQMEFDDQKNQTSQQKEDTKYTLDNKEIESYESQNKDIPFTSSMLHITSDYNPPSQQIVQNSLWNNPIIELSSLGSNNLLPAQYEEQLSFYSIHNESDQDIGDVIRILQ